MISITRDTALKDLALLVGKILFDAGIDAVLTGGAVVSIYTNNRYQSFDLDFITHSSFKELEKAFEGTGFYREGRFFKHPHTDFIIDFPAPPLAVGNQPVKEFNKIIGENRYLKLLTPTHSVMDRLAAFFHWDDFQALEQALMVALDHDVDFKKINKWSNEERMGDKYERFLREYKIKKQRN